MTIYYSAKENTFYDDNVNEYISDDVVEISAEHHTDLLNSQTKGFVIKADENGYPVSVEIQYSQAELDSQQEAENIAFLSSETRRTSDAIAILDDAIEFEIATDEEIVQHKELRKYRIELMRVKEQEGYPLNADFPTCPDFFSE